MKETGPAKCRLLALRVLILPLWKARCILRPELMPCCLQRGTTRQEQKAEEADRRASAMLQFQEDRDRRRLQDESAQVSAQLAAQAAEQARTLPSVI